MNTGYYEMRVFAKDAATISAFEDEAEEIFKSKNKEDWHESAADFTYRQMSLNPFKSIFVDSKPIVYKNYYLGERCDFLNLLIDILHEAADKFASEIIVAEIDHELDEAKACLFETLYETAAFKIRNGLSDEVLHMFFEEVNQPASV